MCFALGAAGKSGYVLLGHLGKAGKREPAQWDKEDYFAICVLGMAPVVYNPLQYREDAGESWTAGGIFGQRKMRRRGGARFAGWREDKTYFFFCSRCIYRLRGDLRSEDGTPITWSDPTVSIIN
jgi:hypothetical protein